MVVINVRVFFEEGSLVGMKILHVLDHSIPLHSGYTFRTLAILEQQRAFGWDTFHVTSAKHKGAQMSIEEVDGFSFFRSQEPNKWLLKLPTVNQFAIVHSLESRLDEVMSETEPDIVHAHSPALNGLAALRAAQRHSLPVVYECRAFWEDAAVDHGTHSEGGWRYRATHMLETHVFEKADAVTTICDGLRQNIIGRGIPAQKITVIPNAVDINRFEYQRIADSKLKNELELNEKLVLGFIGSFYAYEGLTLLLESLQDIVAVFPEIKVLLVGGGPQEMELKLKVERSGMSKHVTFIGRVRHDQVQNYYDLVDIFVYPRLSMRLTELVTPLKPLEAMAQGRLVIASDVGGHRELIDDGKNGCLFQAGDPKALARAVIELLDNKESWPDLREAGRKFVEEERNWFNSVSRYRAIYQSLI